MRRPQKNGFSLVEALVAAALLSLSIVVVIAVIKNGRALDINDLHRRQARAIINSSLNNPNFDYSNFGTLRTTPSPADYDVTIDNRDGVNKLIGRLKTQIILVPANASIPFEVVKIIITITWQEPGFQDSVVIEKWLTEA